MMTKFAKRQHGVVFQRVEIPHEQINLFLSIFDVHLISYRVNGRHWEENGPNPNLMPRCWVVA